MIRHKIFGIAFLFLVMMVPVVALGASFGSGVSLGLGGKVTKGPASLKTTITCTAGYGPFMLRPFNTAGVGPYFIRIPRTGTPRSSGYVLGLYKVVPDIKTCYNPETGAPVPAFELTPYGASR